jgi:hypothetical protein
MSLWSFKYVVGSDSSQYINFSYHLKSETIALGDSTLPDIRVPLDLL